MATLYSAQWIKFFVQAGIPESAAATYALTFAENRIQMNMLLDLNKEYLRDMGITRMGDVIAILKHARTKHEEIAREKLLVPNERERSVATVKSTAAVISNPLVRPSVASKISAPDASRLPEGPAPPPPAAFRLKTKPASNDEVQILEKYNYSNMERTLVREVPMNEPAGAVKRKVKTTVRPDETINGSESFVKKARRVLPEEEGGYKIKMPSGSTPRSQQILAKSKELESRKPVFERLGSGTRACSTTTASSRNRSPPSIAAVSSTTGVHSRPAAVDFVVKKIPSVGESSGYPLRQPSSVFKRLGDKQVTSSTSSGSKRIEPALPYAGILKSPPPETKRIIKLSKHAQYEKLGYWTPLPTQQIDVY